MAKHEFRSLRMAAVCLGSVLASCSEQAATSSGAGGAGGQAAGGVAGAGGSVMVPPLVPAGGGGAAGSNAGSAGSSAGLGGSAGAATAGAAGSGGQKPYVAPVSMVMCGDTHVGGMAEGIADFEEGLGILPIDGRGGIWFGYSDGTGKQTDSPIPVVDSDTGGKAMHVSGSGFKNWGSGIGSSIAFDFDENAQCPYDASAFSGLRLRLKGEGSVRLRITQVATTPATAGDRFGTCDPNRAVCDGHHEVTIELTEDWSEHAFEWADFEQAFGKLEPFDAQKIIGVSFEFNSLTTYDVWVDDIAFIKSGAGGEGGAGNGGEAAGGAAGAAD